MDGWMDGWMNQKWHYLQDRRSKNIIIGRMDGWNKSDIFRTEGVKMSLQDGQVKQKWYYLQDRMYKNVITEWMKQKCHYLQDCYLLGYPTRIWSMIGGPAWTWDKTEKNQRRTGQPKNKNILPRKHIKRLFGHYVLNMYMTDTFLKYEYFANICIRNVF